ncbi:unnamed protein product [Closterium sp. Yama58-4]|nr:unnamed protein product [Closterium sp. Yama58-4]
MSQELRAMRRLQQQLQLRGVTVDRAALQSVAEYVVEAGCSEQRAVDDLLRGITALELGVQVVSREVVRQVLLQPLRARSRGPPADGGGPAGGSSRGERAGDGARPDALGGVGRNGGAGEVMEGGRGEAGEGWMREWRAVVVIDAFTMPRVDYDPLRKHFSRCPLPAPLQTLVQVPPPCFPRPQADRACVVAVVELGV